MDKSNDIVMVFEDFTFFSRLIIVPLLVHQISLTYQDLIWIILYFAFVYRLHHLERITLGCLKPFYLFLLLLFIYLFSFLFLFLFLFGQYVGLDTMIALKDLFYYR